MGNDIEIRVRVADNSATGVAAVNTSLNQLKTRANEAGNKLDGLAAKAGLATVALEALKHAADSAGDSLHDLRTRADAAGHSMRDLRDGTTGTNNSLRTLNTRASTATTRLGDLSDRSRTLRSDTDDLDGSMRRLTGTLGGLRGGTTTLRTSSADAGSSMDKLKSAALTLAPALIPIAASVVPIALNLGAAGTAVAAFGAAIIGQVSAAQGAADAQGKYNTAVSKYGPASEQATTAQAAWLETVHALDPATRRAGAALQVLTDGYRQWSKSLAGDTMPVFTKGLAVAGALLPKLTPMVKGASTQLDRFMTILAGGVNSSGFEQFMESFAKFSTGALSKANDGLVHFMRTLSESSGANSGRLSEFMDYVRKAGPQVGDTLLHLAEALTHIVVAASDTGVSMLGFVNSIAKLIDAVPTGALTAFLQLAVALKAVKLAAAGMAALGGLSSVATSIGAMRTAAAGASGPLAGLSAAFGTLSRSAKVALVGTAIGVLVIALTRLSSIGKQAPPDVDRMTTAIGKLGDSGKVSGEALRVYGKDLGGLADGLRTLSRPSNLDKTQQFLTSLVGMDSTPVAKAKEDLDAVDKSLANLVKGGKTDLAKAAFDDIAKSMVKQGLSSKELRSKMDDYKSALADQALEAKLTAQSQGLFGDAAQKTATKLDAQKQSADGLRGAIQALNNINREGLGGMIGFEAAIDTAGKAARDNAGALTMTNGVLNLNSEKARTAAGALQDLADKTDTAATSQREAGASWETVNGIYSRGRKALIDNAMAMGLSKTEAEALATQILKIPAGRSTKFKMEKEDAQHDIEAFNAAVKASPNSKSVTLKTLSKAGEEVLESFGLKVKRLPDGSVTVSTKGGALSAINNIAAALRRLNGKSATTWTYHNVKTTYSTAGSVSGGKSVHDMVGATGGYVGNLPRRATGGAVQAYPDGGYIQGPGSGTSDSIITLFGSGNVARTSNTEFIVNARQTAKHRRLLELINSGGLPKFAKGGLTQAAKDARSQLSGSFGISSFGRVAGYQRTPFEHGLAAPTDINALVSSLNDAASKIRAAFSGKTESSLLKHLNSVGKALISQEKQLAKVTASLATAKSKLDDLKNSSSQMADSVKSGLMSSANITSGASGNTVTVASIMGGLTASRDKTTAFADALKGLKSKGLDKGLIQQIAEAGVNGGGLETAGALLGASSSEISSANSLQSQIASAATSAGKTTADAYYGAAIKAQDKLVKSLTSQQTKLEKSMNSLASTMEKFISKALKGKASGGIVGAAATGGLRGGLTTVGEQGIELLDLPPGSRVTSNPDTRRKLAAAQAPWASMLNTPQRRGPGSSGGAAGPQEARFVLELRAGDSSRRTEELLTELRGAIKVRGGDVQVVLGNGKGRNA